MPEPIMFTSSIPITFEYIRYVFLLLVPHLSVEMLDRAANLYMSKHTQYKHKYVTKTNYMQCFMQIWHSVAQDNILHHLITVANNHTLYALVYDNITRLIDSDQADAALRYIQSHDIDTMRLRNTHNQYLRTTDPKQKQIIFDQLTHMWTWQTLCSNTEFLTQLPSTSTSLQFVMLSTELIAKLYSGLINKLNETKQIQHRDLQQFARCMSKQLRDHELDMLATFVRSPILMINFCLDCPIDAQRFKTDSVLAECHAVSNIQFITNIIELLYPWNDTIELRLHHTYSTATLINNKNEINERLYLMTNKIDALQIILQYCFYQSAIRDMYCDTIRDTILYNTMQQYVIRRFDVQDTNDVESWIKLLPITIPNKLRKSIVDTGRSNSVDALTYVKHHTTLALLAYSSYLDNIDCADALHCCLKHTTELYAALDILLIQRGELTRLSYKQFWSVWTLINDAGKVNGDQFLDMWEAHMFDSIVKTSVAPLVFVHQIKQLIQQQPHHNTLVQERKRADNDNNAKERNVDHNVPSANAAKNRKKREKQKAKKAAQKQANNNNSNSNDDNKVDNDNDIVEQVQQLSIKQPSPTCELCHENIVNRTIVPCGHTVCHTCIDNWLQKTTDCPYCRATVEKTMTLFLPRSE